MPQRPHTICRQTGCGVYVIGDYCDLHKQDNDEKKYDQFRDAHDPIRRMYNSKRWRWFRKVFLDAQNTCQRIERGVRCTAEPTVVHHLVSPEADESLFTNFGNVVGVCAKHHPAGIAGTPQWRVGVDYAETIVPKFKV